ncbi:MAG TPA: hypothetical protein VI541_06100 [Actinomycetota bacterium]|nr:hypothetical protein [Actinomycetota bacterium]
MSRHARSILGVFVACATLVAMFVPGLASATPRTVQAGPNNSNSFSPNVLSASAGDTVTWNWNPTFQTPPEHTVTGWTGSGSYTDFNSPTLSQTNPSYTATYNGGIIFYRCTNHSWADSDFPGYEGVCHGMCGVVTDVSPSAPPATPTITGPAEGSSTTRPDKVVFTGTGTPWSMVIIFNAGTSAPVTRVLVRGGGTFSVQVAMPAGNYAVFGKAYWAFDAEQPNTSLQSGSSNTRTFSVLANNDISPPGALVTTADGTIFLNEPTIVGEAWDNTGISQIRVYFRNASGLHLEPFLIATCDDCPGTGNYTHVHWRVTHKSLYSYLTQSLNNGFLNYGVYKVNAIAIDTGGTQGTNFSNTITFIAAPRGPIVQ